MFESDFVQYVIYFCAAATAIIIAEGGYLLMATTAGNRKAVNRRMKLQTDKEITQKDAYVQLRKERRLDQKQSGTTLGRKLVQLHSQTAMKMPLAKFSLITTMLAALIGTTIGFYSGKLQIGLGIGAVLMLVIPFMILRSKRKRRHKQFGAQLPEALELITRGLRAGHPVPIAFAMVAREMPDPIGTEFGILSDEITYGANTVQAMQNLYDRVGHEDLPLFVTAVSIQSTTGGSLREILDGLSKVIRDRAKLRRKIKAISVEGRMSAYILTAVPILLALAISLLMPSYYGDVVHEVKTWKLVAGSVTWLLIGNAILFKMASFKL